MSDIPRLPNSLYKEDPIAGGGGKGKMEDRRKKAPHSQQKGKRGENNAIHALCEQLGRERSPRDRRNNQATEYGGAGNPDIQIAGLERLFYEIKNTTKFMFSWTTKLLQDCPEDMVPVLMYNEPRKGWWVLYKLADHDRYFEAWAAAKGYEKR